MTKTYDLEERSFQFASGVRSFLKEFDRTITNSEDSKRVMCSSGSVEANYIEANEF